LRANLDIHRLLDEAFAGIVITPEVQDLKEEMRGNLVARVAELEARGAAPGEAARRAVDELGDVPALLEELAREGGSAPSLRHRVRPRPSFVVVTVLSAVLGAVAVAVLGADVLASLPAALVEPAGAGVVRGAALAVAALAAGLIVGGALRQETTTNHPLPRRRAAAYGLASVMAVAGSGLIALYPPTQDVRWPLVGSAPVLASIGLFAYLLATQTNRHKSWVLRERAWHEQAGHRFEKDPAAAARFGLYTVSIWLMTFVAFGALTFLVGWSWSWLAFLAGLAAMMLTLARMQFGEAREPNGRQGGEPREPNGR
jgi:hypothetical protein